MQKGLHIIHGTAKSGKSKYMDKLIRKNKDNEFKAYIPIEEVWYHELDKREDLKDSGELLTYLGQTNSIHDLLSKIELFTEGHKTNTFFIGQGIQSLPKTHNQDVLQDLYNLCEYLDITIVCQVQTRRLLENEKEPYFLFPYPAILHKVYIEGDELFFERKHSITKENLGKASYELDSREEK